MRTDPPHHRFHPGDPVIVCVTKQSARPGPRAREVWPNPRGDNYSYAVDKLWVVEDVLDDGRLVLRTRRGKRHVVEPDRCRLRSPSLWERWIFRDRFPHPSASADR